jgi:hypothetical protein
MRAHWNMFTAALVRDFWVVEERRRKTSRKRLLIAVGLWLIRVGCSLLSSSRLSVDLPAIILTPRCQLARQHGHYRVVPQLVAGR